MTRKRYHPTIPLKLYSTAEAATFLQVSPETVRRLARLRHLGMRKGRDWLFTPADLDQMRARPRVGTYDRNRPNKKAAP